MWELREMVAEEHRELRNGIDLLFRLAHLGPVRTLVGSFVGLYEVKFEVEEAEAISRVPGLEYSISTYSPTILKSLLASPGCLHALVRVEACNIYYDPGDKEPERFTRLLELSQVRELSFIRCNVDIWIGNSNEAARLGAEVVSHHFKRLSRLPKLRSLEIRDSFDNHVVPFSAAITEILKIKSLRRLEVEINSPKHALAFATALENNSTLEKLEVSYAHLDVVLDALATTQIVDMKITGLKTKQDVKALSNLLTSSTSLQKLFVDIDHTEEARGEDCILELAEGLRRNRALTDLRLLVGSSDRNMARIFASIANIPTLRRLDGVYCGGTLTAEALLPLARKLEHLDLGFDDGSNINEWPCELFPNLMSALAFNKQLASLQLDFPETACPLGTEVLACSVSLRKLVMIFPPVTLLAALEQNRSIRRIEDDSRKSHPTVEQAFMKLIRTNLFIQEAYDFRKKENLVLKVRRSDN